MLNDVSTDLEDPPTFTAAQIGPLPDAFKDRIKSKYPDLKPLAVPGKTKAEVFGDVVKVAKQQQGWEITHEDAEAGTLEGVQTTRIMRFKDDFVVRVRGQDGEDTVVDMRSKSRVGRSDLGANAYRIEQFFTNLKAAMGADPAPEAPPADTTPAENTTAEAPTAEAPPAETTPAETTTAEAS